MRRIRATGGILVRVNASALVARLLLAVGGVAACSRSSATIRPETEGSPGEAEAAAGAPGARRKAEQESGSGAGPTALCNEQIACVAGTWCGHHTSSVSDGYFGPPSTQCLCTEQGKFSCLPIKKAREAAQRSPPQVCLPREGECPGNGKPLMAALRHRHQVSCPVFVSDGKQPAVVKKNSEGKDECCYSGYFSPCEGRPLVMQGQPRWAPLRSGVGWG